MMMMICHFYQQKKHTHTVYTRPRKNFLTATFSVVVSFGRLSSFIVFVCQYMFTFIANASTPLSWKIIVNVTAIFVCMYRKKKLRIIQFDAIMQTVIIVIVVKISESNINDTHTHTHDLALKIYFKIVPSHLFFVALLYLEALSTFPTHRTFIILVNMSEKKVI